MIYKIICGDDYSSSSYGSDKAVARCVTINVDVSLTAIVKCLNGNQKILDLIKSVPKIPILHQAYYDYIISCFSDFSGCIFGKDGKIYQGFLRDFRDEKDISGKLIRFTYKGGSSPNTIRYVKVFRVEPDRFHGYDVFKLPDDLNQFSDSGIRQYKFSEIVGKIEVVAEEIS